MLPFADWPDEYELRPDECLELCRELAAQQRAGAITVTGRHQLDRVKVDGVWADDTKVWVIHVLSTDRKYELRADTYHGKCGWRRLPEDFGSYEGVVVWA